MKVKVYLLSAAILLSGLSCAFAYTYSLEKVPSGKIDRPVSKQTSSIIKSSINKDEDIADYNLIIEELQNKIAQNPNDYSLFPPLIEAYLKTNKYEEAYFDLEYLNSLKNGQKLSQDVLYDLDKLRQKLAEKTKYMQNKTSLLINLALINLIFDRYTDAENCLKKAALRTTNHKLYLNALKLIIDTDGNYENGIILSNSYIENNNLSDMTRKEIKKIKVYFYINLGQYEDALSEQISILQGTPNDSEALYSTYNLLIKCKASEDKILKTLFSENSKNKEQCYYDLYKLLIKQNNYEDANFYSTKLEKQYPKSLNAAFLKAENLIREGQLNKVPEVLNSVSDKLVRDEDIAAYNRLMALVSKAPDKEALRLFEQGYPNKALELLEDNNIPDTASILAFKARCCIELKRMQQALEYLNKALYLDSENLMVNLQFADYYFINGDYEVSRKYAEKALQMDSQNKSVLKLIDKLNEIEAAPYINQIATALESQNYKEASRLIGYALDIAPNSSILYYYQGLNYIAGNNYAASTGSLYKSLELDRSNILAYYYLGIAFDYLAEYENAYENYAKFLRLLPRDELGESEKIEHAKSRINKIQHLL